jgi:hypothetical protein
MGILLRRRKGINDVKKKKKKKKRKEGRGKEKKGREQ